MENKENILNDFILEEIINRPKLFKEKLVNDDEKFNHRLLFNQIKDYLDDFLQGKSSNRFIVMPGLRGLGKTTILYQLYEYLLNDKNIEQNRILYLSCDIFLSFSKYSYN